MDGPEPKLRELFSRTLQCQNAEAQAAYLEQACHGNAHIARNQVVPPVKRTILWNR